MLTCAVQKSVRSLATAAAPASGLKARFKEVFTAKSNEIKEFRKVWCRPATNAADAWQVNNNEVIGTYTVDQAYGGMRGIVGLVTETSLLDPQEGIRYRGHDLFEISEKLPKVAGGDEPLPEGVFWLLLTGDIPTEAQVASVTAEWNARASLPSHVVDMVAKFPTTLHPMSQFSSAICAMQSESKFAKAYAKGLHKNDYWEYTYEDSMDLIAKLPTLAALIYRHSFKDGKLPALDPKLDQLHAHAGLRQQGH